MNISTFRLAILGTALFSIGMPLDSARADTIVHFSYSYDVGLDSGGYDVQVYSDPTPITAKNFLRYVNNGAYDNTIIQRSGYETEDSSTIMQGGGYSLGNGTSQEAYPNSVPLYSVQTYAPIVNEPGLSNLRGTIAMAKQNDNPDSATSQWYVNIGDNSSTRDNQNGGYTVFGKILGDGMTVIDDINANNPNISPYDLSTPEYYNNPALNNVPLYYTPTDTNYRLSFITIAKAAVVPAAWKGGDSPTGDWGQSANWDGAYNLNACVPDGAGSKITLDNQGTDVKTVDMASVGRTVGSIVFTGNGMAIASSGGFSLTLDNIDQPAEIDVTGTHAITAPVILAGDANISGSGVLTLSGGISGAHTLTVASGTLNATSIQVDSLNIGTIVGTAAVPEPSTAALLGLSILGLFAYGWRSKK